MVYIFSNTALFSTLEIFKDSVIVGVGSSAVVRSARIGDDTVAVKTVDTRGDEEKEERVMQEYSILKRLNHRNIIRAHDIICTKYSWSIVTEFMAGGTVHDLVMSGAVVRSRSYHEQLMHALAYLHSQSVMHRDVKPTNLLLSADLEILKLADFNCAREIEECISPTGTMTFAAPEQLALNFYSEKVDIWAAGRVLDFMGAESRELRSIVNFCCVADPSLRPSACAVLDFMNMTFQI